MLLRAEEAMARGGGAEEALGRLGEALRCKAGLQAGEVEHALALRAECHRRLGMCVGCPFFLFSFLPFAFCVASPAIRRLSPCRAGGQLQGWMSKEQRAKAGRMTTTALRCLFLPSTGLACSSSIAPGT